MRGFAMQWVAPVCDALRGGLPAKFRNGTNCKPSEAKYPVKLVQLHRIGAVKFREMSPVPRCISLLSARINFTPRGLVSAFAPWRHKFGVKPLPVNRARGGALPTGATVG